jgi:hypothetical protein
LKLGGVVVGVEVSGCRMTMIAIVQKEAKCNKSSNKQWDI